MFTERPLTLVCSGETKGAFKRYFQKYLWCQEALLVSGGRVCAQLQN